MREWRGGGGLALVGGTPVLREGAEASGTCGGWLPFQMADLICFSIRR